MSNDSLTTEADVWPRLPLRGWDLVLIVLLAFAAVLLLDAVLADVTLSTPLLVATLVLQSLLMLGAVCAVAVGLRGATAKQLGLRPSSRRWYIRAVEVALLTLPLVWLINAAVQWLSNEPFRNPQIDVIAPAGFSWFTAIGMTVVTGIVAPIAEEIAFRGVLYGWLRQRFGVTIGVIASALLFSLAHGIPALIPALAVQGVILALVYEKSRSLWPAMITHGTYNTATVILLYAALGSGMSA
ncbi:type II CAAX endopeptidase family protein [Rhodospirillaceae bacterium SYSU D60014]|uniref:CPBP family intramembrane glutamic endopeptidase n=1 Tax=Virgifigura deserti TaxID=2268457 RepID=UPI000E65FFC4